MKYILTVLLLSGLALAQDTTSVKKSEIKLREYSEGYRQAYTKFVSTLTFNQLQLFEQLRRLEGAIKAKQIDIIEETKNDTIKTK